MGCKWCGDDAKLLGARMCTYHFDLSLHIGDSFDVVLEEYRADNAQKRTENHDFLGGEKGFPGTTMGLGNLAILCLLQFCAFRSSQADFRPQLYFH